MSDQSKLYLKKLNLKATTLRIAVLEFFQQSGKPVSLADIREHITQGDTATLYRTVNEYLKLDIIKAVNLTSERAYFELKTEKHHHHISCISCGLIEDISGCNLQAIDKEVLAKSSFKSIKNHSLELQGVCKNCTKKTSSAF